MPDFSNSVHRTSRLLAEVRNLPSLDARDEELLTGHIAGLLSPSEEAAFAARLAEDPHLAAEEQVRREMVDEVATPARTAEVCAQVMAAVFPPQPSPNPTGEFVEFLRQLPDRIAQLLRNRSGTFAFGFAGTGASDMTSGSDLAGADCICSYLPDGTARIEVLTRQPENEGVKIEFACETTEWRREAVVRRDVATGRLKACVDISPEELRANDAGWESLQARPMGPAGEAWTASAPEPAPARANTSPATDAQGRRGYSGRLREVQVEIRCGSGGSLTIELSAEKMPAIATLLEQGGVKVQRPALAPSPVEGDYVSADHRWVYRIAVPGHDAPAECVFIAGTRVPLR